MRTSSFFRDLRSAYEAEIDDLTSDSEGHDVLRQRLAAKRKEITFLRQMIEISPEMVAVVFHQGFQFKLPSVMDHLVAQDPENLPEWDSLAGAIEMRPWTQDLVREILKEPMGEWFMTVAAGVEYLYGKADAKPAPAARDEEDHDNSDEARDHDSDSDGEYLDGDDEEEKEARAREDAGADWMVEQGFDRKDR